MVKRLSVFLLIFSLGCFVLTCAQTSKGQTVAPKQESTSDPVTSKLVAPQQQDDKQEPGDKPAAKQEKSKSAEKKSANKTDADSEKQVPETKQDEKKADKSKKDTAKADPATTDADNKQMPAKPETKLAEDAPAKVGDQAAAKTSKMLGSEFLLPPSTKLWVSIPDSKQLTAKFDETQIGLLAKDEAIKPFIESFRDQIKDWLNSQNVRLGMDVDDINDVQTGEICVAGVLPELDGKQAGKAAHGLVLLVDVSETEDAARDLLKKVNAELKKRGAKQATLKIHNVEYIKSTLKNPKRFRPNQSNYQTIVNGWMLVSDNEMIFRDVLVRLATNKVKQLETLSAQPSFVEVRKNSDLRKETPQVSWFVDPFGYLQLAQAIEAEDRPNRVAQDDWAGKLRSNGFDAFQGVGGNVAIATSSHEVLHRTYVYAPNDPKTMDKKHVFDLFDFSPVNGRPLTPANWVPSDCSDYFVANWNMTRALRGFGVIYDGFMEEGAFERMKGDFRVDKDMQLDLDKLIGLMDDRFTVVSAVKRPITETSERICVGIPIKGEPKYIFDSIKRASRGQVIKLGRIEVIKVDSTEPELEEDDPLSEFELEGADDFEDEEEDEDKREFQLFKQRFFVVRDGHLLVANNKDFLRELMAQKQSELAQCPDYIQIKEALGEWTDDEKVNFRQFGRLDRALETNYEMIRRGEMGQSQTVLARVVNQIFAKKAAEKAAAEGGKVDPDAIRKQKLDGSKLPEDYAKSIAPYFGPTGWVMETEKNGWRITGCVLKKKEMTEVVQKAENGQTSQR